MNQLDFSPISEKDQQSIDTFSFLHNPIHSLITHRNKPPNNQNLGCFKMFDRLSRTAHNRKSYSFQLLKQFILFSSDEDTIQIHYKYTQFQLDEGVECLENTFGLRCKLSLGKAFQDIRNYSKKVSVYRNPEHLHKLTNVYEKVMKLQQKQSYKCVIKILASYIEKAVIPSSGNVKNSKLTVDLIETLQRQIQRQEEPWQQQRKLITSKRSINRSKRLKKDDLLKTSKPCNSLEMTDRIKVSKHWKEEVQNVDSYEQQQQLDYQDRKMIMKSMSSQLHNHQNAPQSFRGQQSINKNSKAMSISVTPVRRHHDEQVFQTKRKNSSVSMSRNSQQQIVQNVIIIRSTKQKSHNRQPDRFIRVPVLSDQIKIVQVVPDQKTKKQKPQYEMDEIVNKNLQTISSRHKSSSNQRYSTARNRKASNAEIEKKMRNMQIEMDESKYEQSDTHECIGCKYCQVIKEMETYRLQRNKIVTPLTLL